MIDQSYGTYIGGDGPLHRLDARAKLCGLLAVTVGVFCANSFWMPGLLLAAALLAAVREGVTWRALAAAIAPALIILLLAFISNALVADGTGDVSLWGPLGVSWAGFVRGVQAVLRILCVVAWSLTIAATTSSTSLVDAFISLAKPLRSLGFSAARAGMMLSLVLRFLPLSASQISKVRDAQRARGLDLEAGSPVARLKRWVAVLIPVTVALFAQAQQTGRAMQSRCWGYREPQVDPRPLGVAGWCVVAGSVVLVLVSLWLP